MTGKVQGVFKRIRERRYVRVLLGVVLLSVGLGVGYWVSEVRGKVLGPSTQWRAAEMGRKHAAPWLVTHGGDVNQDPVCEYFKTGAMGGGEPMWAVGFKYPAPRDKDGKIMGVREFCGYAVFLDMGGRVVKTMVHSP